MSAPFVGRQDELRMLGALITTTRRANVPAAGLIVGEPGSGKTRLLREVVAIADPRRTTVIGLDRYGVSPMNEGRLAP